MYVCRVIKFVAWRIIAKLLSSCPDFVTYRKQKRQEFTIDGSLDVEKSRTQRHTWSRRRRRVVGSIICLLFDRSLITCILAFGWLNYCGRSRWALPVNIQWIYTCSNIYVENSTILKTNDCTYSEIYAPSWKTQKEVKRHTWMHVVSVGLLMSESRNWTKTYCS